METAAFRLTHYGSHLLLSLKPTPALFPFSPPHTLGLIFPSSTDATSVSSCQNVPDCGHWGRRNFTAANSGCGRSGETFTQAHINIAYFSPSTSRHTGAEEVILRHFEGGGLCEEVCARIPAQPQEEDFGGVAVKDWGLGLIAAGSLGLSGEGYLVSGAGVGGRAAGSRGREREGGRSPRDADCCRSRLCRVFAFAVPLPPGALFLCRTLVFRPPGCPLWVLAFAGLPGARRLCRILTFAFPHPTRCPSPLSDLGFRSPPGCPPLLRVLAFAPPLPPVAAASAGLGVCGPPPPRFPPPLRVLALRTSPVPAASAGLGVAGLGVARLPGARRLCVSWRCGPPRCPPPLPDFGVPGPRRWPPPSQLRLSEPAVGL
ncbi:uncharacterized protein LOC118833363 [Trichosurus vulpecula]|uniref:uncharacterized protein LOC118833363 n=1 Tax=Trichosurus vulpecula TaxID=9337 RepID=UPI00186ADF87|nr:uncharacterized protein LOC118833363 [Trichosurus vulpecula]